MGGECDVIVVAPAKRSRNQQYATVGDLDAAFGSFFPMSGDPTGSLSSLTESDVQSESTGKYILRRLRVVLDQAGGEQGFFTLMVNGTPSALVAVIGSADVTGSNLVDEVKIEEGDLIDWFFTHVVDGGYNATRANLTWEEAPK